ncbi:helix-turn-helix domain-containing protein [Amycolatopsis sp. PS_44_ISF1]|uniref:TetR/AcrR family transcriptional regulator n=1 Tax=Amycolatopsis sp. PS_44_ISF1 TaxID=2974917 RepID=UPI0028DF2DD1|nr:helix-turn-helix domain-containing protein [Amycolatopsis sp. PS_44_ISF1]MDT8915906.1 TetR/AcrR family transcriptional regulator [Amycolatopsis sp. PS_44_ISF1]
MTNNTPELTQVQQQRRQTTVDALLQAAQRGLIDHGLDVSMDDIAQLAEVGRRTVFRYFATREDLLSEAIATASAGYLDAVADCSGEDWRAWLADFALVMHERAARAGRLYWEFASRRLPERLAQAYAEHRQALQRLFDTVTVTVWSGAGGEGTAPEELRQTVAAHLSPMFTQAVLLDAGGTPELAAKVATNAIAGATRRLVRKQSRPGFAEEGA